VGEFLSQSPVTTVRVDLRTLKYGGAPFVLAPQGTPIYQVLVQRILGKSVSQFRLQMGQGDYAVCGQGDRYHFAGGLDSGLYLRLPRWQNVNPGGSGVGIVEISIVHQPDVSVVIPQVDPLALTRLVSGHLSVTAAAAQFPEFDLINPFNPANSIGLFNAPAYGHCRRFFVTCSIDGRVTVQPQQLAAPVAGAVSPLAEHVSVDNATMGPPIFLMHTATPPGGGPGLYDVGVRAGQVQVIDVLTDLWPSITNAQVNALSVFGPVGPCTMTVTAEWQELELN
jgi:hypothetical protein